MSVVVPYLEGSFSIPVDEPAVQVQVKGHGIVPAVQVKEHVIGLSFFRNYVPQSMLNVDASIGGHPASTFGFWEPTEANGCGICGRGASRSVDSDRTCSHPSVLYTAAREIANLLKCRDLPDTAFWKVAEDVWQKQAEASQKTMDAKAAKVAGLISEIYQLVGLAAAFQGLLITAAAQLSSSSSSCSGRFWWLLTLSVFATVATATGVKLKVGLIRVFRKALNNAKPLLYERKRLLRKLMVTEGPGFNLVPPMNHKPQLGKFKTFVKETIYPNFEYSGLILACLIAFGIICGFALAFICK